MYISQVHELFPWDELSKEQKIKKGGHSLNGNLSGSLKSVISLLPECMNHLMRSVAR